MPEYRHLYQLIEDVFDLNGIRALCMDVALDAKVDLQYENLAGDNKRRKAQELQEFARRNQITPELLQAIHRAKPRVDLTQFGGPEAEINNAAPAEAAATQTSGTNGAQTAVSVPEIAYEDFEISIRSTKNTNVYSLEAKSSNEGQTADSIHQTFPFEDDDYLYLAHQLQDVQTSKKKFANDMGVILRAFLFPPPIQELFSKSFSAAKATGKEGLRIRLNIKRESNELYQVPWEYCRGDRVPLAVDEDTPLVRYMDTERPTPPITMPGTVRILLAWANPKDLVELEVQSEIDAIKEALADFIASGKVVIEELPNATSAELFSQVAKNPPHIFHFIGHGKLNERSGGAIAVDNGNDGHALLDGDLILELFQGTETKLIIFSACQSGTMSDKSKKSSSAQAFMGLAPTLVWGGLPAVIAMQYDLPNNAARPFMGALYEFLALGKPLDWAMNKARLGLRFAVLDKSHWGIPVLFMRAPDGKIWA